jgi:hypothetical protein
MDGVSPDATATPETAPGDGDRGRAADGIGDDQSNLGDF